MYKLQIVLSSGQIIHDTGNYKDMEKLYKRFSKAIKSQNQENDVIEYYDGETYQCFVVSKIEYIELGENRRK